MEFDQFMLRHLETHREVTKVINGWPYLWFMKLAELTKYVDFGCDFDDSGVCKKYQGPGIHPDYDKGMCCCSGCKRCGGFLYVLPADRYLQEEYARMYDDETGFWRKEKGCILPRRMRSSTCLTYNCTPNRSIHSAAYTLFKLIKRRPRTIKINRRVRKTDAMIVQEVEKWLIKEAKIDV